MKSFGKLREACWKGYKAVGNKKKGDRLVPNCVPEEVQLQEEDGYPHEVHVRNYDEPDDEHSTFPKDHINYGVNMHHGTYKGATDKGYVFGFREKEHANKFVQHVNTHKHTHADHISEEVIQEADKKDTVTVDIPLLIRLLEHAREDIKSDMDLHRVVEKLISIRNKGVLTMADYNTIVAIKEEIELDEAIVNHEDIAKHLIKKHGKDVTMDHIDDAIDGMDDAHKVDKREVLYHIKKLTTKNEEVEQIQEIGKTEQGKKRLKDYRQKATLDKTYTMMRPSAPDALNDRKWKNRNVGIARATKRLGEDGGMGVGALSVPGPTNKTGPQSATDPVSATAVNMKKKKRFATIRRLPPKM